MGIGLARVSWCRIIGRVCRTIRWQIGLGGLSDQCGHDGFVFDGGQSAERVLSSASVVGPFDSGDDRDSQLVSSGPEPPVEDVLLQQAEEALHGGVVAGRAEPPHGSDHVVVSESACEFPGSKLTGFNRWMQHRESPRIIRSLVWLSPGHFGRDCLKIVVGLELCGWDVAEFAEESSVVEPVDPFEGGELQVLEAAPRSLVAHEFGLVEAVDGLGHGVVVAVAA